MHDLCLGGPLSAALGTQSLAWNESVRLRLASGVAAGLAFLHGQSPPIVHRDIKPDNILLSDSTTLTPKIADFGSARLESIALEMTTDCSTPIFSAPEQLARRPYGASVDVWAYGCVLVCLFRDSQTPYGEQQQLSVEPPADTPRKLKTGTPADGDSGNGAPPRSALCLPLAAPAAASESKPIISRVVEGTLRPLLDEGEAPPVVVALADACSRHSSEARPRAAQLEGRLAGTPSPALAARQ